MKGGWGGVRGAGGRGGLEHNNKRCVTGELTTPAMLTIRCLTQC